MKICTVESSVVHIKLLDGAVQLLSYNRAVACVPNHSNKIVTLVPDACLTACGAEA